MYKRLLDKEKEPSQQDINSIIGEKSVALIKELELFLRDNYDLVTEIRFPFGNNYGWGRKYSHKTKHLCYAFFETGAFTITIQIGKNELSRLDMRIDLLSEKARELWKNRYPCGDGGWVHYRVLSHEDLNDIKEFIMIKKKPSKGVDKSV